MGKCEHEAERMPDYNQIAWLPPSAGLTGLGLVASWLVWRHRGTVAGAVDDDLAEIDELLRQRGIK
ncbi:MAG: hypothetical protein ACRDZO_05450 [Egibacteraceae bacterium]